MGDFVHLHVHTQFSLLDGACRISSMVKQLKELGQTAVAITDHGNMYGTVDFYKACKKEGIHPIIGCEVYVAPRSRFDKVHGIDSSPYHLVLLCKNETGYQNLIRLVSAGHLEGFYHKPRIDRELLEQHHEGLIALSACLAGEIPRYLCRQNMEKAEETARYYQGLFGEDYYIELQDHGIAEQKRILPALYQLAQKLHIPVVATNDAHYLRRQDAKTQSILMCIQTNTVYGQTQNLEFETEEFYLKSYDEMHALFSAYEGALENTVKIAAKCQFDFQFGTTFLPKFTAPDSLDNVTYFEQLCRKGLLERYGNDPAPHLKERLEYELSTIKQMGYVDYFLIVYDFIRFAKEQDIPVGPGRGSGAGSLAAYCIGITGIDPMQYDLLFERFLNPERVSMPDFDVDFCIEKRQKIIDYVIDKYGADHVAQIITFGTMAAKLAIRDVGRALGVPYQKVDAIAKLVPRELNITLEKALEKSKDLAKLYAEDTVAHDIIYNAMQLEGMPRHASTHAAGVVITRDPTVQYVPLQKNDEVVVTQFPMFTLEELGLLKMDFLGLRNLTVIRACEEQIRKKDPVFSVQNIPMNDPGVYAMLSEGDTDGVFQLESAGVRQVLMQLKPQTLEDIIAVISLYRPGPMESIPRYIEYRHHPERIQYLHPLLEPILKVTYGCIVYQEQVMQICQRLAGYSYGRADLVRRAMSKKKADVMQQERHHFIYGKTGEDGRVECVGAIQNGVSEAIAQEIFDQMSAFASYAFNKSHAAAYSHIAYQTAYLKYHYKAEYMAALLSSVLSNADKIHDYIAYCKTNHVAVVAPSVNDSEAGFTVQGGKIHFGLLAIKNLGKGVISRLMQERTMQGPFRSLYDFCTRMQGTQINKRAVEGLIKSGAMDCLGHTRASMLQSYEGMMEAVERSSRTTLQGQIDLFSMTVQSTPTYPMPDCPEYAPEELLQMEKESTGLYLSGHPLDQVPQRVTASVTPMASLVQAEDPLQYDGAVVSVCGIVQSKKVLQTKSNQPMAFLQLEDKTSWLEVIVFPKIFEQARRLLESGEILWVKGTVSVKEDDAVKLLANEIKSLTQVTAQKSGVQGGKLYLKFASLSEEKVAQVRQILTKFPGQDSVYFYAEDQKKYFRKPDLAVAFSDSLLNELKFLFSGEDVVYKP